MFLRIGLLGSIVLGGCMSSGAYSWTRGPDQRPSGTVQLETIEGNRWLLNVELELRDPAPPFAVVWVGEGRARRLVGLLHTDVDPSHGRLSVELDQRPHWVGVTRESTATPEIPSEFLLAEVRLFE